MTQQSQGFKRINFFKGFLTTEKDWNDAERYHIEKRRLHNKMMHSPGIIYGYSGDLRVTARSRGDLSVEVQAGYAIDGMGNDLMIHDATIRNISLEEFKLPQTIYIVLRYFEELTDFIAYKENLEYKGHRRVLESCKIEVSQTEPDIAREVELARIYLEKGASRIRDARDPANPQPNEIDLRYVQHQFLRAPALRAQESLEPGSCSQLRLGQQPRLRRESDGADLGLHLPPAARLFLLRLVPDLEFDRGDAGGGVAQRAELDQVAFNLDLVQAAGAGAGAAASAGRPSPRPSISDFDFSSFIIGEGVVTALVILTMRWRSTASLNLNECSSSVRVSLSHSMFIRT